MKQKYSLILFVVLSIIIWTYLWLRAIYIPLVHDEIATFHFYIQSAKFIPWMAHWDANNHILNSAISTLFFHIFGLSPLVIRLGNLLMFPLFCIYLWKTGQFFSQSPIRWMFYIALLTAHGFLEFFSLSRGYGISMALLMPALYYLIRMTKTYSPRRLIAVILWGALATLANLSLVNSYLLIILYLVLFSGFSSQLSTLKQRLGSIGWIALIGVPFLILFAMISFEFRAKGLLYTGGDSGIWTDTVKTLLSRLFSTDWLIIPVVAAILFALILVLALIRLYKERNVFSPGLVYVIFLGGNLVEAILLHLIFQVNYPENRVALFLFPLFIGSLCFATDYLLQQYRTKFVLILILPLVFIPFRFFSQINLTHSDFYIEDLIPASFYQTVKQDHQPGTYPPIVSGNRLRHFCWSFYDFCEDGTQSQISPTNFPETRSDFQITDISDLVYFREKYIAVDSSVVNQRYLLKRRTQSHRVLIDKTGGIQTSGLIENMYYSLITKTLHGLEGQSLYVGITAEIYSPVEPFHAWIVGEISDSTGQTLRYERVSLYWLRPAWNEATKDFKNGLFFSQLPPGSSLLKVYIWNIEEDPFRVNHGVAELFVLSDP